SFQYDIKGGTRRITHTVIEARFREARHGDRVAHAVPVDAVVRHQDAHSPKDEASVAGADEKHVTEGIGERKLAITGHSAGQVHVIDPAGPSVQRKPELTRVPNVDQRRIERIDTETARLEGLSSDGPAGHDPSPCSGIELPQTDSVRNEVLR